MKYLILFITFLTAQVVFAQDNDHTETAYIDARDENGQSTEVPLKSVIANIEITGFIAAVTSKQIYSNTSDLELQATYVFPGSTKAAVYGMTMNVNGQITEAKIHEKETAQKAFNEAISHGKTASLLQQHKPNVFQMDLGNLPPHSTVIIELKYTEIVTPTEGIYEFTYPTIVGKRFDREIESGESWTLNPYANLDQGPPQTTAPTFDINVSLTAPIPLHGVSVVQHKANITYQGTQKATINLDNGHRSENKDFILKYRMQGNQIETGLMLYEGDEENFFLYLGESPKRIPSDIIPPREYFFIVDVSGSMNGFPLDLSKKLISELLNDLQPEDKFNVLLFASSSATLFNEPVSASSSNIQKAITFLSRQQASGGTHLLGAIQEAFKSISPKASTSFVILTDGFVTVEKEAFDFIEKNLGDANFFPFGIGASVNHYLIEGLAHIGHSEPFILTSPNQSNTITSRFKKYISSPVLTNIEVSFSNFEAYDVLPKNQPDLFAEKPLVVMGKWKGKPKGSIKIEGLNGNGSYSKTTKVSKKQLDVNNEALKHLWARKKLQILSDYNQVSHGASYKEAITAIGLKYSLLSEFTSFLAIDESEEHMGQESFSSGNAGAVPEPHEWALIALSTVFVLVIFLKSYLGQ